MVCSNTNIPAFANVPFALTETARMFCSVQWISLGLFPICAVRLPDIWLLLPVLSLAGGKLTFPPLLGNVLSHSCFLKAFTYLTNFNRFHSCLNGTCNDCDLQNRSGTIFDCPASQLCMENQSITFDQWQPMDLTEMEFESSVEGGDDVIFRCKHVNSIFSPSPSFKTVVSQNQIPFSTPSQNF